MRRRRFILGAVAASYFAALVWLSFVPGSAVNRGQWAWQVAVFLPVGTLLLLMLGRRRWWSAAAFGMLAAAWIEAAQSVWMPVGYASATDIVLGGAGAMAGVLVALALTTPRRAARPAHESHSIVTQGGNREIPQD